MADNKTKSMEPQKGAPRLKELTEQQKQVRAGLSVNTLNFLNESEEFYGSRLRITSGKRNPNDGVGRKNKPSKHHTGDAFDIGGEHDDFYYMMLNKPKGLEIMNKYGFGAIDETNPEEMKKNNASGAHFHFGIDPYYANIAFSRHSDLNKGIEVQPMISYKAMMQGKGNPATNDIASKVNAFEKDPILATLPETDYDANVDEYVANVQAEEQANEESSARASLQNKDNMFKEEQAKLDAVMSMYSELENSVVNSDYMSDNSNGISSSNLHEIQNQNSLDNIFIGGYNG